MTWSDDRRAIFARRRRFLLAALAGAGLRPGPALAQAEATDAPPPETDPATDPDADRPPVWVTDDAEGELEPPPEEPGETQEARPAWPGPLAPVVCLSLIPETSNGVFRHDGFYLRVAAGPSFARATLEADAERTLSGAAAGGALDLGLTVARGLVIGAGGALLHLPDDAERSATFVTAGPSVDYFPDPRAGLHCGGRLGPALVLVSGEQGSVRALGGGAAAFVGYDAFVAEDWSLGAVLEAGATLAGGETDAGESFTVLAWHAGPRLGLLWH